MRYVLPRQNLKEKMESLRFPGTENLLLNNVLQRLTTLNPAQIPAQMRSMKSPVSGHPPYFLRVATTSVQQQTLCPSADVLVTEHGHALMGTELQTVLCSWSAELQSLD